jgi:hypothetical protein
MSGLLSAILDAAHAVGSDPSKEACAGTRRRYPNERILDAV